MLFNQIYDLGIRARLINCERGSTTNIRYGRTMLYLYYLKRTNVFPLLPQFGRPLVVHLPSLRRPPAWARHQHGPPDWWPTWRPTWFSVRANERLERARGCRVPPLLSPPLAPAVPGDLARRNLSRSSRDPPTTGRRFLYGAGRWH